MIHEKLKPVKSKPKYPLDVFPRYAQDYMLGICRRMPVPSAWLGGIYLGMIAAAIVDKVRLQVDTDWEEPANIYILHFIPPSGYKSPSFKLMTEAWRAYVTRQIREYNRLPTVDDCTPEALIMHLCKNKSSMAILSPEGTNIKAMFRYAEYPNDDIYLCGWSGDPYYYTRRNLNGKIPYIEEALLVISIGMQPIVKKLLLDNKKRNLMEDGYLSRFLYSEPDSVENWQYDDVPIPADVKQTFNERISSLLNMTVAEKRSVKFTSEAAKLISEFSVKLRYSQRYRHIESIVRKLPGQLVRLSGLLHFGEYGEDGLKRKISASTVKKAQKLLAYYFRQACAIFDKSKMAEVADHNHVAYPSGNPRSAERLAKINRIKQSIIKLGGNATSKNIAADTCLSVKYVTDTCSALKNANVPELSLNGSVWSVVVSSSSSSSSD